MQTVINSVGEAGSAAAAPCRAHPLAPWERRRGGSPERAEPARGAGKGSGPAPPLALPETWLCSSTPSRFGSRVPVALLPSVPADTSLNQIRLEKTLG